MNEKQVLVDELIAATTKELRDMNYKERVIIDTTVSFRQLSEYAAEKGKLYYGKELVDSFMREKYGYPTDDGQKALFKWGTVRGKLTDLKKLEWMYKLSHVEKRLVKIRKPLPICWNVAFDKFLEYQVKNNFTDKTKGTYKMTLNIFADYLVTIGSEDITKITPEHIYEYVLTMRGQAPTSIQGHLGRVRRFCKFLYIEGITATNLESAVPKLGNSTPTKDSNIWSKEELEQIFDVVDRGNATGKRDYAMVLMAIDLGMRLSDIVSLTLENINWEQGSIAFNQSKTNGALSLPLTERVGLAVIDYLKYARPKTDSSLVFVRHTPPYNAIKDFSNSFTKYVNKAGITKAPKRRYGMHSLRHTLATRMLEAEVAFDVIIPMIGHADENTLSMYLNLDIENLRKCALSPEMEVEQIGL